MQVREVMTEQVQCCSPDTNLAAATEIMWNNDCGVLLIVDDGKLAGIVTDRDICIALGTRNCPASDVPVSAVENTVVETCEPDDDVYSAMELMQTARVRRLPVVNGEGSLQGIVTLGDLASRIGYGTDLSGELLGTLKAVSSGRYGKPVSRETGMSVSAALAS